MHTWAGLDVGAAVGADVGEGGGGSGVIVCWLKAMGSILKGVGSPINVPKEYIGPNLEVWSLIQLVLGLPPTSNVTYVPFKFDLNEYITTLPFAALDSILFVFANV
jgi:hypothetical protein